MLLKYSNLPRMCPYFIKNVQSFTTKRTRTTVNLQKTIMSRVSSFEIMSNHENEKLSHDR